MKGLFIILLLSITSGIGAQSFYFGPKLGPTMGFQRWDNFQQSPIFTYHGAFFVESYSKENSLNSLYAQIGWHNRGSAYRNQRIFTIEGDLITIPTRNFQFSNAVLAVGGKRKQQLSKKTNTYYFIGLRGEYTVLTNLYKFEQFNQYYNSPFYPDDFFVKRWNYGVSAGGGIEFKHSKYVWSFLEVGIHPDLSRQYEQPPIGNVVNPWQSGSTMTINERRIKNITLEVSVGLKFFREVIYLNY